MPELAMYDHHLTTTHTKAREASVEKASRAFYQSS